jgi:D-alanyl-D-alanine carboxypeptidase
MIPKVNTSTAPSVSSPFVLIDSETNTILAQNMAQDRIYPASTTKLATALTALNIYPLDETISVGSTYSEGKIMDLKLGEKLTTKSLITSLLIFSANDSAYTLANHHSKGVVGFVDEMNKLVAKNKLTGTHFTNFDGIHSPDHYSTAYDLSQLARLAIKNQFIRDTVKTKEATITDVDNLYQHHITSTNELLGVIPEIEGLKTGWTPEASGCFVGLINLNGHYLISVVAQSMDRFADTKVLVDWAKQSVSWKEY